MISLSETPVTLDIEDGKNGVVLGNVGSIQWNFVVNDKMSIDQNLVGVESVMDNNSDASSSYYLLNGLKVNAHQKGAVMIQVKGGRAKKIISEK